MPRIRANLPDHDIKWLDQRAAEEGKSRAWLLRKAVEWYRRKLETQRCAF